MIGALLLGVLTMTACKNRTSEQNDAAASDFMAFYERFLSDSLFQIEHVQFPLEGIPDNADSTDVANGSFRWQRETWKMHRKFDPAATGFQIKLEEGLNKNLVTERIMHESGHYGMLRRYALMDGEWRLIYYAGLNSLAGAPE